MPSVLWPPMRLVTSSPLTSFKPTSRKSPTSELTIDSNNLRDKQLINVLHFNCSYGDGFSTISDMIKSLTIYMNKDYHKQQLQALAANCHKLGLKAVEVAIEMAMAQVNDNIYWRNHSYDSLKGFLEGIVSELQINIF